MGRTPVRVLQLVSEVMETRHPQGWVCCASRPTPPLPRWHVHSSRWLAWCVNTSLRGRVLGRRALKLVHALSKRWAQQNQEWLVEGPLPLREVVALSPYGQSFLQLSLWSLFSLPAGLVVQRARSDRQRPHLSVNKVLCFLVETVPRISSSWDKKHKFPM